MLDNIHLAGYISFIIAFLCASASARELPFAVMRLLLHVNSGRFLHKL